MLGGGRGNCIPAYGSSEITSNRVIPPIEEDEPAPLMFGLHTFSSEGELDALDMTLLSFELLLWCCKTLGRETG